MCHLETHLGLTLHNKHVLILLDSSFLERWHTDLPYPRCHWRTHVYFTIFFSVELAHGCGTSGSIPSFSKAIQGELWNVILSVDFNLAGCCVGPNLRKSQNRFIASKAKLWVWGHAVIFFCKQGEKALHMQCGIGNISSKGDNGKPWKHRTLDCGHACHDTPQQQPFLSLFLSNSTSAPMPPKKEF